MNPVTGVPILRSALRFMESPLFLFERLTAHEPNGGDALFHYRFMERKTPVIRPAFHGKADSIGE